MALNRRVLRFAVLAGVALLALPLLSFVTLITDFPKSKHKLIARASEASGAIDAVFRFRDDHGLWPEYLSDLVPGYLALVPNDWEYVWRGYDESGGGPALLLHGPYHMTLSYEFPRVGDANAEGFWECRGEGDRLKVSIPKPALHRAPHNPEQIARMRDKELRRRIKNEPNDQRHRREEQRIAERGGN